MYLEDNSYFKIKNSMCSESNSMSLELYHIICRTILVAIDICQPGCSHLFKKRKWNKIKWQWVFNSNFRDSRLLFFTQLLFTFSHETSKTRLSITELIHTFPQGIFYFDFQSSYWALSHTSQDFRLKYIMLKYIII